MDNIYNAIQNVYNMDKTTWQEVLAELYNLVSNIENKFDLFEIKFGSLLGEQVTRELKKMYDNGSLASLINDVLLQDINEKVDTFKTEVSEQLDTIKNIACFNWVTPEMYGAKGDGITDDTSALQEAFKHDNVMLSGKYRYSITNQFTNRKNINIVSLTGATLINEIEDNRTQQEGTENVGLSFDNCENVYIDGISFEWCFYGIRLRNCKNVTIKNTKYHTFRFGLYMYAIDMVCVDNFFVQNKRTTSFNWDDGIRINGWAKNIYINKYMYKVYI